MNKLSHASRMDMLPGEGAIETFARAQALEREGRSIIHLEIGEPDFDTPLHIVDAAIGSLHNKDTHYTPAPGIRDLREAVAAEVSDSRQIDVRPENVIITPGAKPIVFFAFLALVEPGEEVIIAEPGFPAYRAVASFLGAKIQVLPLREEREFRFDIGDLRAALSPRTKMIILNSPSNPAGSVLEASDLAEIAALLRESNAWVLSDEIYRPLTYDVPFHSIASQPGMQERTIILDGFSKTYAMTGWRLGFGVMPIEVAEMMTRLIINSTSCTNTFVQRAGVVALRGPQAAVQTMVEAFRARRDLVVEGLNKIPGWKCGRPRGAFYAFPNIRGSGMSSRQIAEYLLNTAGVALLPGTAFGLCGEGYLRLSYANSEANLHSAIDRIYDAVIKL